MADRLWRWWLKFGFFTLAGSLALLFGWWVRQSEGAVIADLFAMLSAPFVPTVPTVAVYRDDQTRQLQDQLDALQQENRQLRNLLSIEDIAGIRPINAQVIGRSGDHWWQELVLNCGRLDGVAVGSYVVAQGGLVGQVRHVSERASRVLLLSDPSSQVGVMTARTRVMGILQGRRREKAFAEFFEPQPQKTGDLIVTSGLSSRFPPGLPVGRITGYDRNQAVPRAEVAFSAPLGRLEWVKIYPGTPADASLDQKPDR